MKRIERIVNFDNLAGTPAHPVIPAHPVTPLRSVSGFHLSPPLWTASVFTAALLLCVALAFCQEGRQATTNQAGAYTLQLGNQTFTGTVTHEGNPLAGAVVTVTPSEVIKLDDTRTFEVLHQHPTQLVRHEQQLLLLNDAFRSGSKPETFTRGAPRVPTTASLDRPVPPVQTHAELKLLADVFRSVSKPETFTRDAPRVPATASLDRLLPAQTHAELKLLAYRGGTGTIALGQEIPFSVEVINVGTKAAENVEVTISFGVQLEPRAVSGHDATYSGGQVFFDKIPTIPARGRITLRVHAEAKRVGAAQVKAVAVRTESGGKIRVEQVLEATVVERPLTESEMLTTQFDINSEEGLAMFRAVRQQFDQLPNIIIKEDASKGIGTFFVSKESDQEKVIEFMRTMYPDMPGGSSKLPLKPREPGTASPETVEQQESRVTFTVHLSNVPAEEIAPILNTHFKHLRMGTDVVADPKNNALIVRTTPQFSEQVQKIVQEIDARPPMDRRNLEVSIEKPSTTVVDEEIVYKIKAKNVSDTPIAELTMNVEIPSWIDLKNTDAKNSTVTQFSRDGKVPNLVWHVHRINPGETEVLTLRLIPREKRAIELSMQYGFHQPKGEQSNVLMPMIQVTTVFPEPKLEMEIVGPDELRGDESVTYTLVVRNVGNYTAENLRFKLNQTGTGNPAATTTLEKPLLPGEKQEIAIAVQAGKEQEHVDITVAVTGIARDFMQKGVFQELRNEVKRNVKVVRGE